MSSPAWTTRRITELAVATARARAAATRITSLRHSVVVREQRATFSLAPGGPPRPGTRTPLPGFYLAGDWTDTGLPGTIEGAVQSGHGRERTSIDGQRTDP